MPSASAQCRPEWRLCWDPVQACSQLHPPARGPPQEGTEVLRSCVAAMRGPQALLPAAHPGRTARPSGCWNGGTPGAALRVQGETWRRVGRRRAGLLVREPGSAAPASMGCLAKGPPEMSHRCTDVFRRINARSAGLWKGAGHPSHQDCSEASLSHRDCCHQKNTSNKRWGGCGEKGAPPLLVGMQTVQPPQNTVQTPRSCSRSAR